MKLKLSIMDRVFELATAKEIDFLIYTLRFQDKHGIVAGLKYQKVCEYLNINKSTFYRILESLEKKELIKVLWDNKRLGFWSYQLPGNCFFGNEDYKQGYINLNTAFLQTKEFLSATKAEKIICLKILSLFRLKRKSIPLKLETLMAWTGSSLQSVKEYIKTISTILKNVTVKGGLVTLDFKEFQFAFTRVFDEADVFNEHFVTYIADASKITATEEEIKDTAKLYKLFGSKYGHDVITTAVVECIKNQNALIAKYINTMIGIIKNNHIPLISFK